MNYDFFADKADKLKVLDFIFKDTDLHVYDLGSPFGQEICEYKTVDEIASKFDLDIDEFGMTFQLWTPRHKGKPIFRKVDLDPKRCNGHTFRYSTEGWGLIQLYFGGLNNNELKHSHIGHFNEKGALKWENTNKVNGLVSLWDWSEIQQTSRKLKYHIHNKLTTRKIGSFGVLPGADQLEKQGIILR
ncbi:hypothetical protein EGI22_09100 [Lacihabitans sp. LS3-19]|uniref:hypothetical protein n=1 Tax=Lacihabitans sp. LS3-19 TaxID=2487335 RepID=UPI0020CF53FB|nr:hypothetical protein [Lacihabitans sp. LS3-19]MCP9768069.1 hypothetical protein [Lacihabitans sp. LS3-19]